MGCWPQCGAVTSRSPWCYPFFLLLFFSSHGMEYPRLFLMYLLLLPLAFFLLMILVIYFIPLGRFCSLCYPLLLFFLLSTICVCTHAGFGVLVGYQHARLQLSLCV